MATIPLPKAKKSLAERAAESLRKANFTDEEKRMIVEGTDAQGAPLSESKKMELSKMFTARTSGLDWRKKAAERLKAEEPARAQQALEERAAVNRRMREESQPTFLPEKADVWTKSPTGGEIKVGAETLKRAQELRAKREEEKAAKDSEYRKKLYAIKQEGKDALKKKYEEGLAAKGFAPPKTREEQAAIDRARMEDFKAVSAAKRSADYASQNAARDYRKYNILKNRALREGNIDLFNQFQKLAEETGGSIKDPQARNKLFQDREMAKARELIKERDAARRESMQKQSTSTPEASSFTPTATGSPLAIGSDMPSYQLPYQKPAGPTEQPFGMTTPAMFDSGVNFSSISPYNPSETRITEAETETVRPTTRSIMPATKTSKQQTIEDVMPGASKMPVVQRNPKETPAQHNARVMQEYEKNVVIPSFDKQTQDALMSATELNKQKDELFSQRFTSPERSKQYKDVSAKASKQQDILKKSIDKLRAEKRNLAKYPMNSKERQFIDLQIATLQNQLGFIAKRLY